MLLEVVVAIAIMLLLAAAITPVIISGLDAARVDQTAKILANIAAGAQAFDDEIGSNAGPPASRSEYPLELTHLVNPITTSQLNVCNRAYDTGDTGAWNGPYLTQAVPPTGIKTGIGTVNITTVLLTNTTMAFRIPSVSWEDANALNDLVDGDGSTAAGSPGGTVRFGAADVNDLVTVDYVIPIQSC
jgi:type II secretory pathway pseudopilin PulG